MDFQLPVWAQWLIGVIVTVGILVTLTIFWAHWWKMATHYIDWNVTPERHQQVCLDRRVAGEESADEANERKRGSSFGSMGPGLEASFGTSTSTNPSGGLYDAISSTTGSYRRRSSLEDGNQQTPPQDDRLTGSGSSGGGPSTADQPGSSSGSSSGRGPAIVYNPSGSPGSGSSVSHLPAVYRGKMANITDYPWTLAVGIQRWPHWWFHTLAPSHVSLTSCTGSLIRPDWAVTAAHCVKSGLHKYWVVGGTDCRPECGGIHEPTARRVRVRHTYHAHVSGLLWSKWEWLPKWKTSRGRQDMKYDVALLHLEEPLTKDGVPNPAIAPIEMDLGEDFQLDMKDAKIHQTGWGATRWSDFPEWLQEMSHEESPLLNEGLRRLFPHIDEQCADAKDLICIHHQPGITAPTRGDSGGPWVMLKPGIDSEQPIPPPAHRWILVGVDSHGTGYYRFPREDRPDDWNNYNYVFDPVGRVEEDEPILPYYPLPGDGGEGGVGRGHRQGVGRHEISYAVRIRARAQWIKSKMALDSDHV